jgi:hypothetical protein
MPPELNMNCITHSYHVDSEVENLCYLPPRLLCALTVGRSGICVLEDIPEISVVTNQFLFSPKQLQIQQTITQCQLVIPLSYAMPTT